MCASWKCHQRKLSHIPMAEGRVWIPVPKESVWWDEQVWRTGLGSLCVLRHCSNPEHWGCFTSSLTWRAASSTFQGISVTLAEFLTVGTTSCWVPVSLLPKTLPSTPCDHLTPGAPKSPNFAAPASHNQCCCWSPSPDWGAQSKGFCLVCTAHPGWHSSPSRQEMCWLWEMCIISSTLLPLQGHTHSNSKLQSRVEHFHNRELCPNMSWLHKKSETRVTTRPWD